MCIRSIVVHVVFNAFTAGHIVDRKVFVFVCLEDQMLAGWRETLGKEQSVIKNWTDATSWVQGGTKKTSGSIFRFRIGAFRLVKREQVG